ncbi:MAG: FAD/NAD(P)-binding protein, partial [Actinomycetes bacterium]
MLAVEDRTTYVLVSLASGRRLPVQWVVNCTGPRTGTHCGGDGLVRQLLQAGLASAGPLGMGLATADGRLIGAWRSTDAPIWTLGSTRRGELWESTAVPEIRAQADQIAQAVLAQPAEDGRPPARPVRDLMGLRLSTSAAAGAAFDRGLDAVMRLRSSADAAFAEAVSLDPGFALGHAALAMLGHEGGADVDVAAALSRAIDAVQHRATERERSMVAVVAACIGDCQGSGARALLTHVRRHPRDVLAVSAAVPTIAFSGVTDVQQESG